jgi:hypothetical protein
MNPSELIELRRLAENTTPGRWELFNGYLIRACNESVCTPIAELNPPYRFRVGIVRGEKEQWANGEFMAAANPQAILALLNDRDQLSAEVEQSSKAYGLLSVERDRLAQRAAELEARAVTWLHGVRAVQADYGSDYRITVDFTREVDDVDVEHIWTLLTATPPHGKDAQTPAGQEEVK